MTQRIEVVHRIDGTTKNDTFTADAASVTMSRGGKTCITLTGGADRDGPVRDVIYRRAEKILRRTTTDGADHG